jgi:histidyl-tRNA synthetase
MRDLLPKEAEKLRFVASEAREVARLFCFQEIITPLVEHYELLAAKTGREIQTRMFAFDDLGGRRLALRPEFTASVARLVATTLRSEPKPLRLFSTGSLYRYDEPQFGRYREFWQSNFEVFGSSRPEADVEILSLTHHLMKQLGIRNYRLKIGHVGIARGLLAAEGVEETKHSQILQLLDAEKWDAALAAASGLGVSEEGLRTLKRIIETKGTGLAVLRKIKSELVSFTSSLAALENLEQILLMCPRDNAESEMSIELGFARGLEYYTGMIFEVVVPEMDVSLGGGGRYDKLVEIFGGEPTPAVGVAHGLDRITLAMDKQSAAPAFSRQTVGVIPIGEEATSKAAELAALLRDNGIAVEFEVMRRKVARALKDADRKEIAWVIIVGPQELKQNKVIVREMKTRHQEAFDFEDVVGELTSRLN